MSHVFYVLLFFVIKCSMPFLKDTALKKKSACFVELKAKCCGMWFGYILLCWLQRRGEAGPLIAH